MKTKYKAVKRWAPDEMPTCAAWVTSPSAWSANDTPHWVLPATPEAFEAQVEAMARTLHKDGSSDHGNDTFENYSDFYLRKAVIALAALGIKKPRK